MNEGDLAARVRPFIFPIGELLGQPVGGAIVHDNKMVWRLRLIDYGFNRAEENVFSVVNGDDSDHKHFDSGPSRYLIRPHDSFCG